ncbi:MAG: hypothetical protein DMF73_15220 [Acidobacteria bacterium]|nr:MAG: hypothetical protein DMF73_15220 [Acidobacteriota bacterium]
MIKLHQYRFEDLKVVIELGHQPLCDALLTTNLLDQAENPIPLRPMHCSGSRSARHSFSRRRTLRDSSMEKIDQ